MSQNGTSKKKLWNYRVDLQMDIETLNSKHRNKAHEKEVNERINAINRNKKIS